MQGSISGVECICILPDVECNCSLPGVEFTCSISGVECAWNISSKTIARHVTSCWLFYLNLVNVFCKYLIIYLYGNFAIDSLDLPVLLPWTYFFSHVMGAAGSMDPPPSHHPHPTSAPPLGIVLDPTIFVLLEIFSSRSKLRTYVRYRLTCQPVEISRDVEDVTDSQNILLLIHSVSCDAHSPPVHQAVTCAW